MEVDLKNYISMRFLLKCFFILLVITMSSSCSKKDIKQEDKIITDLNDIFDPQRKGDTDWNYTEIDEDWLTDAGLYYDDNVKAYRQRQDYDKQEKEKQNANPIFSYLIIFIELLVLFEAWQFYVTYQVAYEKHRIIWLWLLNSSIGGIGTFVILCLSKTLKYDKNLETREQPDLLGITIALGNITSIIILYLLYDLYITISANPNILKDYLE